MELVTEPAVHQIPVTGGHISAHSVGRGPAVIFLHGGPGDTHHYMKRMAEPLFSEFQCIFFDQRGTGSSVIEPRNASQFRLQLLFEDLLAVGKHFGASSPILVGHSWGAMYALFSCLQYPAIFKNAILLNMGPLDIEMERRTGEHLTSVLAPHERDEWQRLRAERNAARDRGDSETVLRADKELMRLRVKAWIFNPDLRAKFLEEYFQDPPPDREVNKWVWEGLEGWFTWDRLRSLRARVLVVAGADDSVPVRQARMVEELAPNAKVTIFEQCGHIPWFEYPEALYATLREFLRSDNPCNEESVYKIRPLNPNSDDEIELVAQRMRETLVEVLGEEEGGSMYTMDWLKRRVMFHLDSNQSTAQVFLAEDGDGRIVGHTIVRLDRDDVGNEIGLFSTTYVAPEFRNRAVAKQLLHHGESWIRERGMAEAATYTSDSNTKLINLYEGHGYEIAAKYPEKKMIKLAKALPPMPTKPTP